MKLCTFSHINCKNNNFLYSDKFFSFYANEHNLYKFNGKWPWGHHQGRVLRSPDALHLTSYNYIEGLISVRTLSRACRATGGQRARDRRATGVRQAGDGRATGGRRARDRRATGARQAGDGRAEGGRRAQAGDGRAAGRLCHIMPKILPIMLFSNAA